MCELSDGPNKTDLQESRRHAARLMKRLITHFRGQMDEKLQPFGVTKAQIQLLVAIRTEPGSSGAHLARLCEVTPQTMQGLIQKAEESGWITRSKDTVNDRIITAVLTPTGKELLRTADAVVKEIETRLWSGVSIASLEALSAVLEKCLENIASK